MVENNSNTTKVSLDVQLSKLQSMKERGLINEEEYESLRKLHIKEAVIKNEEITITGNAGKYFSVFPFGSDAAGVSIKGAKYNVEGAKMNCEFPIGVSNEFVGGSATVGVKDGALLIICEI